MSAPQPVRLTAPGMRGLAVALWIAAVVLLVAGIAADGIGSVGLVVVPSLFTAWLAWVVLWRPRIDATADALVIVDVRRTTTIDWWRVEELRSTYGLEVVTSEGVRRTWTAPRTTARLTLRTDDGGSERLGVPAAVERLAAFMPERVAADGPPPATVVARVLRHRTHGWDIALLVALGIAGSLAAARL